MMTYEAIVDLIIIHLKEIERHDTIGLEESNNADQTVLRPKGFILLHFLQLVQFNVSVLKSKSMTDFDQLQFDYIITLF